MNTERKRLNLAKPPEYEYKLLTALAFFLGRPVTTQANAALCMYLRQSSDRIMSQVKFYAHKAGMNELDFLNLIHDNPDKAREIMEGEPLETIHEGETDVFTE